MMKKIKATLNLLVIAITTVTLMTSCGGGSKKGKIAKVKPEKIEISGDLTDYLQIVDNEYEITDDFGGNLSIKVKAIKALKEDEMKDKDYEISASLLGDNGIPVSGAGEFKVEYTNKDKLISLLKKGSGEEVIQLKTSLGDYKSEEHAEKSKKFSVSSTMKVKEEVAVSYRENTDNSSDESITASSSIDCDQFITDYEEFVNKYIIILKKYKANPTDPSILSEYTELAAQAANMQTDASTCTDVKYATKLMKLNAKIANVAAGM